MEKKGRFFGYGRASTNEQETTLEGQADQLNAEFTHRYAPEGWAMGGLFIDRGVSGSIPLGQRPQGVRLLAELGTGDVFCVSKLDRGFRSLEDLMGTLRIFEQKGVRLVLLDLRVDTGTLIGKLLVSMLAAVAEFERGIIGERVRAWARTQREHGRPAGNSPWGFKSVGPEGKRKLVRDDEARGLGSCICSWLDRGWNVIQIRDHLAANGYSGKDGPAMHRSTIYRIAQNERALQAYEQSQLDENQSETEES